MVLVEDARAPRRCRSVARRRAAHGSSISQSRYVRTIEYSPARLGHALEALQLLARVLLDLLGHLRLGDRLRRARRSRRALVVLAQLLLDRAHLLAQQVLALRFVERLLRLLVDLARQPSAPRCGARAARARLSRRAFRSNVSRSACFSSALMSIRPAMKSASAPGSVDALHRGSELGRHLRQQLQDLAPRAPSAASIRALDLGRHRLRIRATQLHARDQERIAFEELAARGSAAGPAQTTWCAPSGAVM